MIRQIQLFLGPVRIRALMLLLAITGLISLMLNAIVNQYDWVRLVQSGLILVFIVGAAIIVAGRMQKEERGRWIAILLPSIIAVAIAFFIAPQYGAVLVGGALGWIVAALFLTRSPMPMEYKEAVK